jgi:hypothetical protein
MNLFHLSKFLLAMCWVLALTAASPAADRSITHSNYFDKVYGGWLGKISGLWFALPREFSEVWPPSDGDYYAEIPSHYSDLDSGDDIYFPLLTLVCLKKHGTLPPYDLLMKEWAGQLYTGKAWGANADALENHFAGVPPPKAGEPGWNWERGIDAQIDLDSVGWVAPGLINEAARISDHFAHVVGYADGADGGVFVAALMCEAFFERDMTALVRKAASVLPQHSLYLELVNDLLKLRETQPDWRVARQHVAWEWVAKRGISAKSGPINGAAIVIGLLYGKNEFAESIRITTRCGWDSDCNASSTGGILGTALGASRLDPKWTSVFHDTYENYCPRGLPRWMRISDIARDTAEVGERVLRENGVREQGDGPERSWLIPDLPPRRLARDERYTPELLQKNEAEVLAFYRERLKAVTATWDPAWQLVLASFETQPEVLDHYMGRKKVLKAQPNRRRGAVLERTLTLVPGKHHFLKVGVANHARRFVEATGRLESGKWRLEIEVNGEKIGQHVVSNGAGIVIWQDPQFDLTRFAGQKVMVRLLGLRNLDYTEFHMSSQTTYWSGVELITLDQPESWR